MLVLAIVSPKSCLLPRPLFIEKPSKASENNFQDQLANVGKQEKQKIAFRLLSLFVHQIGFWLLSAAIANPFLVSYRLKRVEKVLQRSHYRFLQARCCCRKELLIHYLEDCVLYFSDSLEKVFLIDFAFSHFILFHDPFLLFLWRPSNSPTETGNIWLFSCLKKILVNYIREHGSAGSLNLSTFRFRWTP